MVLMKLFAGQQWRQKHKNRHMDMGVGRKKRVGFMERVTWKLTLPYVK